MAIDTAEKRRSASGMLFLSSPIVTPNASKDSEWRAQAIGTYSGIGAIAGATTIAITGPSTIVKDVPRNYTYTPDGDATGVEVTPTTDGTGTFDPASDTFVGSTPLVFEYTATDFADSPHTLGSTDDGGLTNGTKVVTVLEVAPPTSGANRLSIGLKIGL